MKKKKHPVNEGFYTADSLQIVVKSIDMKSRRTSVRVCVRERGKEGLTHVTINARSIMSTARLWVIKCSGHCLHAYGCYLLPSNTHTHAFTSIATTTPHPHSGIWLTAMHIFSAPLKCRGHGLRRCWRKHRRARAQKKEERRKETSRETHFIHSSCTPIDFYVIQF